MRNLKSPILQPGRSRREVPSPEGQEGRKAVPGGAVGDGQELECREARGSRETHRGPTRAPDSVAEGLSRLGDIGAPESPQVSQADAELPDGARSPLPPGRKLEKSG